MCLDVINCFLYFATVCQYLIEDTFSEDNNVFMKYAPNITTPTQIIWGDQDAVGTVYMIGE